MNILLFLTLILLIVLFIYSMFIEPFTCYDQNYEFVPISEYDYKKDTKFINQFDNNLDLDMSEYKNLRKKLELKQLDNTKITERNIDLINKLDKSTNYPLIKRELSLIEFDDILTRLKENPLYKYSNCLNLKNLTEIKYDQTLLYSYHLVKEWIIEKISVLADDKLYAMTYVNNERFKYIEDKLLTYNVNYNNHLEQFIFKMRVYRPNKQTHFIVYFDILFDNYNIKYFINDLLILGTDIEENILFSKFKKNHYGITDEFESDINLNSSDVNKFIESNKKKKIYEYDRNYCFYKDAKDKNECISISKNNNTIGIYDSPCLYDEDCPFYKKNNNYPNKRGGCKKGYCEMPVNINLLGYKEYLDSNKAICYNCKKQDCTGIDCNMCCDDQKDSEKYPNLNGPDYAYPNDFNERIKHSKYFENNNLTPIKLIA
jgi:hypothetical protein